MQKDKSNFNVAKLVKGNWVCEVAYYRVVKDADKDVPTVVVPKDSTNLFGCSKVILEDQFYHSRAFEKTDKITRTELV